MTGHVLYRARLLIVSYLTGLVALRTGRDLEVAPVLFICIQEVNMEDSDNSIIIAGMWVAGIVCEIHGLYLSYHEGFKSLVIAFFIPPWAVIKGLVGFF